MTHNDPSAFISLPEFFDIVLVDAPCSGEGMFRDLVAREEWSPANAQLCSERQRRIVMDIWPALKPGGVLIYSTCTFNPAENEENILWLTQNTDSESVRIDISSFSGITEIGYNGITGYGFHPGRVRGDGFFLSVVRKPGAPVNYRVRSGKTKNRLSAKLLDDMSEMISIDRSRLFQRENKIIGLATDPEMFIYLGERLNVIKAGTLAGEIKNRDFVPGHDLAMSVHLRKEAFQVHDVSYDEAVAFLRFDAMSLKNAPSGRILLSYRDVPLGFANNLGRRINNGYPQAWRIRMQQRNDFRDIL